MTRRMTDIQDLLEPLKLPPGHANEGCGAHHGAHHVHAVVVAGPGAPEWWGVITDRDLVAVAPTRGRGGSHEPA